jgi:hypothetical protein
MSTSCPGVSDPGSLNPYGSSSEQIAGLSKVFCSMKVRVPAQNP